MTLNKGVQLLSVLELWLIVETLVMSENEGTTVREIHHTTVVCATRFRLIFSVAEHDGRWRVINTNNNNNNTSYVCVCVCVLRVCGRCETL